MIKFLFAAILAVTVVVPARAGVINFYTDQVTFRNANQFEGKMLKGIETFEEAVVDPGGKIPFPDPLWFGVPNGPFLQGLAEPNICIQANIDPNPNPPQPNPSLDPMALYVLGPGGQGANSKKVGEDLFLNGQMVSLDLIFDPLDNHTGVGFLLSRFAGFLNGGWHITVYDKGDAILGKFLMPAPMLPEPNKTFFGVWSSITIGRINIFDNTVDPAGMPVPSPDAIDDIEMWVPEPTTLSLLGLGMLVLARRRRVRM